MWTGKLHVISTQDKGFFVQNFKFIFVNSVIIAWFKKALEKLVVALLMWPLGLN